MYGGSPLPYTPAREGNRAPTHGACYLREAYAGAGDGHASCMGARLRVPVPLRLPTPRDPRPARPRPTIADTEPRAPASDGPIVTSQDTSDCHSEVTQRGWHAACSVFKKPPMRKFATLVPRGPAGLAQALHRLRARQRDQAAPPGTHTTRWVHGTRETVRRGPDNLGGRSEARGSTGWAPHTGRCGDRDPPTPRMEERP